MNKTAGRAMFEAAVNRLAVAVAEMSDDDWSKMQMIEQNNDERDEQGSYIYNTCEHCGYLRQDDPPNPMSINVPNAWQRPQIKNRGKYQRKSSVKD